MALQSPRDTFAGWLAIAGLPLRRIQESPGHKSIVTTERHSHLGENGLKPDASSWREPQPQRQLPEVRKMVAARRLERRTYGL
jgi:site-specific recombinase XerD